MKTRRRPNILLILTDDQRADTIAALGHPDLRTPHLDSLVRRGTVFRNAFIMGGRNRRCVVRAATCC
jgi:arylsulfatase A-like enzyme